MAQTDFDKTNREGRNFSAQEKHTPTPWTLEPEGEVWGRKTPENDWQMLAETDKDTDAAFIVEACNAHERLKRERDVLKEVANAVTVAYRVDAIKGKLAKPTFDMAEAAIALCEGEGK